MLKITKRYLFLLAAKRTCHIQKNPSKMPRLSKRATLITEYQSLIKHLVIKAYVRFCYNEEDSSEDDIDYCKLAELAVLGALWYCL